MRSFPRKALLLTLSATACAAALTAPAQARPQTPEPKPTTLGWKPCDQPRANTDAGRGTGAPTRECATLSVPLDYAAPGGPQVDIAVARLRSDRPEARRGTLLVIPGGPGGSGRDRLAQKGAELRERTGGAYDIVSLDPRGVGGSSKADCRLTADDRELTHLRPWPGPGGDITENVARARRVADACARDGGALLRSFSTANEVRDIDRFRQALGEEKLSAWGVSYGTYVAAVYAQKYPEHTDRWVLDSSGDPDPSRVARGWAANMAFGAEDRFPDFARWAADPARDKAHRVAGSAADVRREFLAVAAELDARPREFQDADHFPLTGNRLRQALIQAFDSEGTGEDGTFATVSALIVAARDTTGPLTVRDLLPAGPVPQDQAAVMVGTICNDVDWPRSVGSYARNVAVDRARHPLTAGLPAGIFPCAFWKGGATEKPTRVTPKGPSNILMIQNLRDPSTPHRGALKMREAFGDRARLVTVDAGGHGSYLRNGNACGDEAVTTFLTKGTRPAQDKTCEAEPA
ncbi:alpha/beta hydrolase [Streptomyces albireticuli]|uniref:alpha/beta hydrolase n=1 Tax=Streptomyces albireticuli TaxID=1940 RepID=UPI0036CF6571